MRRLFAALFLAGLAGLGAQAQMLMVSGGRGSPAIGGGGGGEGLLSWNASSGATGYEICWSNNDMPGPSLAWSCEDVGNVTSASPTGFDIGDPARIRAYDQTGIPGAWSAEINTPACDQTITTASGDLDSIDSSAPNNSVVCLSNGAYGFRQLWSASRTGYVTFRCLNGKANCSIEPSIGASTWIRFVDVTLSGETIINSCSHHVEIVLSDTTSNAGGIYFDGSGCPSTDHQILIDTVDFKNNHQAGAEGGLTFWDAQNATVQNSTFNGVGTNPGDFISVVGSSLNVLIRNNSLMNLVQGTCGGVHCDGIQLNPGPQMGVQILGNYLQDISTHIMAPDDCGDVTVAHNVFDESGGDEGVANIQLSCSEGTNLFNHNTANGSSGAFDTKPEADGPASWTLTNNIFPAALGIQIGNGFGCSGCVITHNQGLNNTPESGCSGCTLNNNNTTAPTWVGGSNPSTRAGFQLSGGSAGEANGSDGKNRGELFLSPAAPTNFHET